jgi:arylsulfatase A-like enzyme
MKLSSFTNILLSLFFISCSSSAIQTDDDDEIISITSKPNILLVIADDVSKDAVPNYTEGISKAYMPILQDLMNTGITFDNTWTYSVCSPTRASILTGKYGINTGVLKADDPISTTEVSLQKYIKDNANDPYSTAIIGKWHLSKVVSDPISMGVDYYAGILNGGVKDYYNWTLYENGKSATSTEYATTKLTDLAINWVNVQTKPWFLWLAYNAPHTPFHLAPTDLHTQGSLPTDDASVNANPLPYYLSALEALDTEMGRFLSSLSAEERANTVIIFIGDNGVPNKVAQSPYEKTKVKESLYQGGINVPMVVSGIGVDRMNVRETALIHSTDLYTTIGNIAGVSTSEIYNSTSFYNLFKDANATKREFVYSEKEDMYTIRNTTYKYIKLDNGTEELYKLSTDAYETSNLIGTTLSTEASTAKAALIAEANSIRN